MKSNDGRIIFIIEKSIYNNRFLIKSTLLMKVTYEFLYKKSKEMLLIEDIENKKLKKLVNVLYGEFPMPKKKK